MKFCLFYAWREMRRRPLRFISLGCFLGISAFVMTALCLLLTVYSDAPTAAMRQFLALYGLFGVLLIIVIGYLCLERYRSCTAEYDALRQYGLTDAQLQCIHHLQMLLLSASVLPVSQIAAAVWVRWMTKQHASAQAHLQNEILSAWPNWYTSRISFPMTGTFSAPIAEIALCFAAMLLIGWLSSLLSAYWYRRLAVRANPCNTDRRGASCTITDMQTYRRETAARMHSSVRFLRAASAAAMLLPLFFLGASLLFSQNTKVLADMVITVRETRHTTIDAALAAQISAVSGVVQANALTDGGNTWALQLTLDDQSWITAAAEILKLPEIQTYDISVSHLSVTLSNLDAEQLHSGFLLLAACSFFAACIGILFIISDLFRARQTEFGVLRMYGCRDLFRIKASAAHRMLAPCCFAASAVGVGLIICMHLGGGAVIGMWLWKLLLYGIGLGVVLPFVFAWVASWLFRGEEGAENL